MKHQITVERQATRWVARFPFSYETKDFVKEAGFRYAPAERVWYTTDAEIAAKLDPTNAAALVAQVNQAVEASRATTADVDIPAPDGLAYLPYQRAGIAYALGRESTLIGDEMGLGKTIQAIGVINVSPNARHVLVVCPAGLKLNWARELQKWLTRPLTVEVANGTFPGSDVVIINYDILAKWRSAIDGREWDLLVVDEVHYAKNQKAQRTRALFGFEDRRDPSKNQAPIQAKRRLLLTGTPIVNRPIELWPVVQACDPQGLGRSFFSYAQRYCAAYNDGYGWNFSGASNLEELQTKLRAKFMVRRMKADVLKELPEKRRQVVVIPPNGAADAVRSENRHYEKFEANTRALRKTIGEVEKDSAAYRDAVLRLRSLRKVSFEEMAKLQHRTAVLKIPHVIEHLRDALESEDKVVLFCHHHDVAQAVLEAFPGAAFVTGSVAPSARLAEVDRFQNSTDCHLFIGTIHAAGVGLTLTAAQVAVFAELDWVPGNISQAEDRLHRIGQAGSVLIQHLVFDGSLDSRMAKIIIEKQGVISAAMDDPTAEVEIPEFAEEPIEEEQDTAKQGTLTIPVPAEVPF